MWGFSYDVFMGNEADEVGDEAGGLGQRELLEGASRRRESDDAWAELEEFKVCPWRIVSGFWSVHWKTSG